MSSQNYIPNSLDLGLNSGEYNLIDTKLLKTITGTLDQLFGLPNGSSRLTGPIDDYLNCKSTLKSAITQVYLLLTLTLTHNAASSVHGAEPFWHQLSPSPLHIWGRKGNVFSGNVDCFFHFLQSGFQKHILEWHALEEHLYFSSNCRHMERIKCFSLALLQNRMKI